ncbi:MAG: GNAT family N-acetyltransferase [Candidatus Sumerlaeaceae bacterium]
MLIREIQYGSKEWHETLQLRERVLRRPLGLTLLQEELESQKLCIHFAAYDSQHDALLGTLLLARVNDQTVQMRQVAVDPDHQRNGIGRKLVTHAEQHAQQHGFYEMLLHARETAVPFYERLGYRTFGEPFDEQTIPHIAMVKQLLSAAETS